MRKTAVKESEELTARGVAGFFEKVVSRFGNGAKIDARASISAVRSMWWSAGREPS